jgi:hypothetical protein
MLAVPGVTAMETREAAETVSVALPEIEPAVAVMVLTPVARPLALPFVPDPLEIVAAAVLLEVQLTEVVRSWVVLSEKVPVAVNCWLVPLAIVAVFGVTAIETSVAADTASVAVPDMEPDVAVMVVEPVASPMARPGLPEPVEIVATEVVVEVQLTRDVRSCVLPSVYVPTASNCWVVPLAMLVEGGPTEIATRAAAVTTKVVSPLMLVAGSVAVMVTLPWAKAETSPWFPAELETEAKDELLEVQLTELVISSVLPSV